MLQIARILYRRLPVNFQRRLLVRRRQPIWREAGIVFIHIPKVAGTSFNEALYGRFMGHVRASDIEDWASAGVRALPRFAITRNPWDRLVSGYRFVTRGGGVGGAHAGKVLRPEQYQTSEFATFERFVKDWLVGRDLLRCDVAFHPQSLYVADARGHILVDHLGRYEALGETIEFLRKIVPGLALKQSNRSGTHIDYRTFYTPELVDLVGSVYSADVSAFNYRFD